MIQAQPTQMCLTKHREVSLWRFQCEMSSTVPVLTLGASWWCCFVRLSDCGRGESLRVGFWRLLPSLVSYWALHFLVSHNVNHLHKDQPITMPWPPLHSPPYCPDHEPTYNSPPLSCSQWHSRVNVCTCLLGAKRLSAPQNHLKPVCSHIFKLPYRNLRGWPRKMLTS